MPRTNNQREGERKVAHTFKIRKSLLEEVQHAVAFYSGHPQYLSMGEFIEGALESALGHLRQRAEVELKEYGGAFPAPSDAKMARGKTTTPQVDT